MPIASQAQIDPLHAFMAGAFVAGSRHPCPLAATRFDVVIDAGLAVVAMTRTFRNAEAESIEATITFPVPVHAALFALEVRLGGRVLTAKARRRQAARAQYEDALDRGKTAVLHEEVLRGVHMLSVGPIAPDAEIEVRATWAMTLINVEGRGRLRIPLTVGDIYGRSGLSDSDELIHGGPRQTGTLTVDCRDGTATLVGGRLEDRQAEIPLDEPIDIDVTGWHPRELRGRMANATEASLRIDPYAGDDAGLDVAILVDRSGSMDERCSTLQGELTKHVAVRAALEGIAGRIGNADTVDLWEFNTTLRHVGSAQGAALRELTRRLSAPDEGTEIGSALSGVIAGSNARDILLITDGKSYALDVQKLAATGRRFGVVLVGSDSLEAHVGHLAALTGGEIFVAAGPDLPEMLEAGMRSLRTPPVPARLEGGILRERRAGMELCVRWRAAPQAPAQQTLETRAVAALAASLLLPTLSEDAAAELAEAEGLVTHLTSLVLVDEDAAAQQGIPATRKIALPTPASSLAAPPAVACVAEPMDADDDVARPLGRPAARSRLRDYFAKRSLLGRRPNAASGLDLEALSRRVPWDSAPGQLRRGDLSGLEAGVAQVIRQLADEPVVRRAADEFGCAPVVLVIALLARAAARRSRAAGRIARAVLGERPTDHIEAALAQRLRAIAPA